MAANLATRSRRFTLGGTVGGSGNSGHVGRLGGAAGAESAGRSEIKICRHPN